MTDLRIRLAPTTRLIGAALLAARRALGPRGGPAPQPAAGKAARRRTQHADPVGHAQQQDPPVAGLSIDRRKSPAAKASSSAAPRFQPPTIPTRRSHDRPPDSPCPDDAPDRRRSCAARASAHAADPSRRPARPRRRRTQHADPVGHAALRRREEAERVHRQRQHDTRVDDADLRHAGNARGRQGQPVRHGHREQGQGRHHPPGTPRELRAHRSAGLRAEYDGTNSTFDLIGQAVVVRCQWQTVRHHPWRTGTPTKRAAPTKPMAPTRPRPAAGCARWPAPRRTPPSPNAASSRPRRRALSASPQHIRRHA